MQVKYQDEDIIFLIPCLVTVNNHCVISDLTLELTTHIFINHIKNCNFCNVMYIKYSHIQ